VVLPQLRYYKALNWQSMRLLMPYQRAGIATLCVLALACKADDAGDGGANESDAAVDSVLESPILSNIVITTPRDTVAIRGTSSGERVAIIGGPDGTSLASILPGGNFCTDVNIAGSGDTELTVYSVGSGLLSEPLFMTVTYDPAAPEPASPTCSGTNEPNCEAAEICDNELDDNCDGYIDVCDQGCITCVDDALEPNDFLINVPGIEAGEYQLQLCPCRDDWFSFTATEGQHIRATTTFIHEEMNLNMRLYKATPTGEQGAFAAGSFGIDNEEDIDFTVVEPGVYFMRIYILGGTGEQQGAYQLTVP
jgi:hypothetical protein